MVGNFNNIPSFDQETQTLILKPEYVGTGETIKVAGQVLIIFDSENTTPDLYPYYFYNGLDMLFDIVDKI
jgi:hypothetical protein